jgi:hypothetical protein
MDTSINDQSGGTAAETPNINPNPQPDTPIEMNYSNDDPVTLKEAAAEFECAASSLKNNIKSGKLAATQTGEKAPYMVRLSDAERFLRATPGIASIFHPADSKSTAAPASKPPSADEASQVLTRQKAACPESQEAGEGQESKAATSSNVAADTVNPNDTSADRKQLAPVTDAQADPSTHTVPVGGKRRRRRRRGKGGGGSPAPAGIQQPVLKALAGTTPQERLRITACLTELVGLVASA